MCKDKPVINSFQANWPCWAPALQAGTSCVWGSDAGLCLGVGSFAGIWPLEWTYPPLTGACGCAQAGYARADLLVPRQKTRLITTAVK